MKIFRSFSRISRLATELLRKKKKKVYLNSTSNLASLFTKLYIHYRNLFPFFRCAQKHMCTHAATHIHAHTHKSQLYKINFWDKCEVLLELLNCLLTRKIFHRQLQIWCWSINSINNIKQHWRKNAVVSHLKFGTNEWSWSSDMSKGQQKFCNNILRLSHSLVNLI